MIDYLLRLPHLHYLLFIEKVMRHTEEHKTQHIGWLSAAVLGANDGIVSTASLILGVVAAGAT